MQGDGESGDIVATRLWRVPFFMPIMSAFLLAMVAEAMAGSYMALLAVQKIGMSPLELSAFLTVPAVMGIAITTIFGHLQDRKPVIWPMLISLFAKVFGLVACASITQTWLLIAVAGVLFGLSAASFALLFAVAKAYLDQLGGTIVSRGMAALRLVASLSWTIGPALGAALVWARGFAGVYLGAAFLAATALAIVVFAQMRVAPSDQQDRAHFSMNVLLSVAPVLMALAAFHTAMFMGSNAMSIVVARDLGTQSDVGILFSLCAGLEVLVMGAFVAWPDLSSKHWLLFVGFLLFGGYFLMAITLPTMLSLYIGQLPRAAGIGIISIVGMEMVQGMLRGRAGTASALFGNTISVGFLLSGLGTGTWADAFGYWSLFTLCAALCAFGAMVIMVHAFRARRRGSDGLG